MGASSTAQVFTRDGLRGRFDPPTQEIEQIDQVTIRMDNGTRISIPPELLEPQENGDYLLPVTLATLEQDWRLQGDQQQGRMVLVLPVIAEELKVEKRRVTTGKVRVTKKVHERQELVDEPAVDEQVEVRRVAVNRELDEPISVRTEGDTLIIPVVEEIVVIQKRLILKEEVHITKTRKESRDPQQFTLRREEIIVERVNAESQDHNAA